MMPDKSETSDNAGDNTVDFAKDDVVSTQTNGTNSGGTVGQNSNGFADPSSTQSSDGNDRADNRADAGGQRESALEEAINAENDVDSQVDNDDPLDFGDQRMGEDSEPLDEAGVLRVQLAESEARASENWDRLLRLQAEMENQRKRAQNDVTKARKFALESIVSDLLPVKDSLEMGLSAAQGADADPKALVEGANLTLKMLAQVFEKNNIAEVDPIDEKFDPEFHQAMSMQEIEGKAANTVAVVMQKGYTLNDRLVRPALVMVAK